MIHHKGNVWNVNYCYMLYMDGLTSLNLCQLASSVPPLLLKLLLFLQSYVYVTQLGHNNIMTCEVEVKGHTGVIF